jgi:hypothetical protein
MLQSSYQSLRKTLIEAVTRIDAPQATENRPFEHTSHWRKRSAVLWTSAMFTQRCQMHNRAIALVLGKPVLRKAFVQVQQPAVAVDLGKNRCRRKDGTSVSPAWLLPAYLRWVIDCRRQAFCAALCNLNCLFHRQHCDFPAKMLSWINFFHGAVAMEVKRFGTNFIKQCFAPKSCQL